MPRNSETSAEITVVTGPPCGAKSSFVQANRGRGDVVVDFDLLASALGNPTAHDSFGSQRLTALHVRRAAIDFILDSDLRSPAWIIHTSPPAGFLERYERAGAKLVELDPGKAECLTRAARARRPQATIDAIEKWYADRKAEPTDADLGKMPLADFLKHRLSGG